MNALRELARSMRDYAILHPLNLDVMRKLLADPSTPSPYHARIVWRAVPMKLSFTYIRLKNAELVQVGISDTRGLPLPQGAIDDAVEALFDPRDIVDHVQQGIRKDMYAEMGAPTGLVANTEQYLCWNPHLDKEWPDDEP